MTGLPAVWLGGRSVRRSLAAATVVTVVVAITGLVTADGRTGPALLLAGVYLAGLGWGAVIFVALQLLVGARWEGTLRDVPHRVMSVLPISLPLLFVCFIVLPETVASGVALQSMARDGWMEQWLLMTRALLFIGAWIAAARLLATRLADQAPAAGVTVACVLTGWLAINDWLMALSPGWVSTIFGVYVAVGFFASSVAVMLLVYVAWRMKGTPGREVSQQQVQDLATWMFGISCLWAYLWYCQFMIIWYTNQPHEAGYFAARLTDEWRVFFFAPVILKWAVPGVLLLSRAGKRNAVTVVLAGASVAVGQWFDLYLMIVPATLPGPPRPGLIELALVLGVIAATIGRLRTPGNPRSGSGANGHRPSEPGSRSAQQRH